MAASTAEMSQDDTALREEMIHTAVKFLENPNVKNTPLAQKQRFLQRKGLTDQEIQRACEKSGAYSHHEEQIRVSPSLPPLTNTVFPYNSHSIVQLSLFDKIREIVHNVAIFSIVAYIIHKFYQRYIAPFLFGKKKKSIEETVEDMDKDMKSSIGELKDDLRSVKVEVNKLSQSSDSNTVRKIEELKSEIGSVKGLLLGRKQFPSVANSPVVPPSIPAWQMSSVGLDTNDDHDGDGEERKEDPLEVGSGSGSSDPDHGMKTSESSLEIIFSSKDCDSESCHSKKSHREDVDKD